jgi:YD repeat-containing protein
MVSKARQVTKNSIANRLIRTTKNGAVKEYGYDGWGNLIQESTNGGMQRLPDVARSV